MDRIKVNYTVIYKGDETLDLTPGEKYECIGEVYTKDGELHDLAIIDESGEDYLYDPDDFEKVK